MLILYRFYAVFTNFIRILCNFALYFVANAYLIFICPCPACEGGAFVFGSGTHSDQNQTDQTDQTEGQQLEQFGRIRSLWWPFWRSAV